MSKQNQSISGQLAALVAILGFVLISSNNFNPSLPTASSGGRDFAGAVAASQFEQAKLSYKLVNWISEQCEQMAQEMDAIIRLEAVESKERFSVVNYIRYLSLYDQLSVVAKRDDVEKFRWIAKKVKAYKRAYNAATNILLEYLNGLDVGMTGLEAKEKKSRQEAVGKDWVQIYEIINYIATHAPRDSRLANTAYKVLQKSPNGTEDKKRSTRYSLYVRVN